MYTTSQSSLTTQSNAFKNRVALVCMPFGAANIPSIQICLLKSTLEQSGFAADTYHLNLDLAAQLGSEVYDYLCYHRGHMTGEWLFSKAAFRDLVSGKDNLFYADFPDELKWIQTQGQDSKFLSSLRHHVLPEFIHQCTESVDWNSYDLVAFSSTFQQNVASLALARQIKEKYPTLKIAFGGANMEGNMGLENARSFSFIDYVMIGEGDVVFPKLLACIYNHQTCDHIPGLIVRDGNEVKGYGQAPPLQNLDCLPTPNYDEYFERLQHLGLSSFSGILPFESSRGCWWGQKSHCTFCGLNGHGMVYRSKSPQKVLHELSELANKYRTHIFGAVDNILDMEYIDTLFARIQESASEYRFFYEIKANLTPQQIQKLYLGGVRDVQPGIESLSSNVLKLMRKGTTMLLNVRLLKWCHYYHMHVLWNLLWGFPGEKLEDYQRELAVLKLISHLPPPSRCGRVWVERFSPFFTRKEEFNLQDLRPESSYQYVYPSTVNLDEIAYFFDYQMDHTVPDGDHLATAEFVKQWQKNWHAGNQDYLVYRRDEAVLHIEDGRMIAQQSSYILDEPMATIYECCCETMQTPKQVMRALASKKIDLNPKKVADALNHFCQTGLMLSEDNLYLSLALPEIKKKWTLSL